MHTVGSNPPALTSFTSLVSTRDEEDTRKRACQRIANRYILIQQAWSNATGVYYKYICRVHPVYARRCRVRRSRPQELLSFVDRGVTRYECVTRYILQHEEAYTGVHRPSLDIEELCRVARAWSEGISLFVELSFLRLSLFSSFVFRRCQAFTVNLSHSICFWKDPFDMQHHDSILPTLHISTINYRL